MICHVIFRRDDGELLYVGEALPPHSMFTDTSLTHQMIGFYPDPSVYRWDEQRRHFNRLDFKDSRGGYE